MSKKNIEILELATDLVAHYVSHNKLEKDELAPLVRELYLSMQETLDTQIERPKEKFIPAYPIENSVESGQIYCLECGQAYKSLKRHLRSTHETNPKAYREKWDLPLDYPMVAPDYSKQRSSLAKRTGLGKSQH